MLDRSLLPPRFWAKVTLLVDTRCYRWNGSVTADGYATFNWQGRMVLGHRLTYETFVGPIPEGFDLHHRCHHTWCVNPRHLEPVERSEHRASHVRGKPSRLLTKGQGKPRNQRARQPHQPATHCPSGHKFTPENTAIDLYGHRRCRECRRLRNQRAYERDKEGHRLRNRRNYLRRKHSDS